MVPKNFEIGDLVWAKMKGYPFWPGKISDPPIKSKSKKAHHYVYFFGSENYAWIPDENIEIHSQEMVEKCTKNQKRFFGGYLNAVEEIVSASKNCSKYNKDSVKNSEKSESAENNVSSVSKKKVAVNKKKPLMDKVSSKVKNKPYQRKKVDVRKLPIKESLKEVPTINDKTNHGHPQSPRRDDDYAELMRNIPPNNAYSTTSVSAFDIKMESNSKSEFEDHSGILFTKTANEFSKSNNVAPTSKKIGFLGLGNMGQKIVKNLVKSGHSVMVWNRSSSKCDMCDKVEVANTAADVLKVCDITFSCMSSAEVAKNLVNVDLELSEGFDAPLLDASTGEKKGFVELTSLDPESSKLIDQTITLKGGRYLEAQLTGTLDNADSGTLFILTAGDNSLFNDCESCFCAIGETTLYLGGDAGVACKFNIVQNMLLGTSYVAMAESLALIEPIGLLASDFLDILSNGPINSQDIIDKGYAMVNKTAKTNTPLTHVQKNIGFALELGDSVEQHMPLAAAANEAYKHCKLLKYDNCDVSAVFHGTKQ